VTEFDQPARVLDETLKVQIRAVYRRLQENTPGFSIRRPQSQMIAAAANALASGGVGVVEAPTGVGKSLAYLTAGVPVALAQEKTLVISTGTVALQGQLMQRDIPNFLKATGLEATVALAKGRTRYLCTRNLEDIGAEGSQGSFFEDEAFGQPLLYEQPLETSDMSIALRLYQAFNAGYWDGDLDNSPEPISSLLRQHITTPASSCSGRRCPYATGCPVLRARSQVRQAQIVVTNHAFLLSALALDEDESMPPLIVPPAQMLLVIDEGHQLSNVAIDQGAVSLALEDMIRRISRMAALIKAVHRASEQERLAQLDATKAIELASQISDQMRQFAHALAEVVSTPASRYDPLWRAPNGALPESWHESINHLFEHSRSLLHWAKSGLAALARKRSDEPDNALTERIWRNLGQALELIQQQYRLWALWQLRDEPGSPPRARWISQSHNKGLLLHCSPVSAANVLRKRLWHEVDAVLLTSATLSAGGDFRLLHQELALPEHTNTLSLPSPFDLRNQATLIVPPFSASPDERDRHPQEIADYLARELDWKQCSLVLFTSRWKMEKVVELLPAPRRKKVLVQGESAKQKMIDEHLRRSAAKKGSVLFGLNSFGEGLDLPGAACTTVVITQVPFAVPSDPATATLSEWHQNDGRNPFTLIALPHAQRMLTQFAGRLIRTQNDSGRIIILDNRLLTRFYGKRIINALPPFRRVIG